MWFEFVCAVVVGALVLYLPGYWIGRSFGFQTFVSAVIAPMFSGLTFLVLGVVLAALKVSCAPVALFLIALALCLAVYACTAGVRRRTAKHSATISDADLFGDTKQLFMTAGLYVGVSLVVAIAVFLTAVGDPNAFGRFDDSTVHLSVVRGFIETGTYSTLNVSPFLAQGVAGGFYPAEWHIPVAIVASLFGSNVTLATTAMIFIFLAVVFPLSVLFLFSVLFPDDPRVRHAGSLFALAASGFPWGYIVFGQLLPNLMSFTFIPMALALVILATRATAKRDAVKIALAAFIGFVALSLAHPNGAFTFGIWAVVYAVSRFFYLPQADKATFSPKRLLGALALAVVACGMWVLMYNAPFMQAAVQNNWSAFLSLKNALLHAALFKFGPREGIHMFLAVLVFLGVVRTLVNRKYLWLSIAYLFAFALYVIDAATDGPVKHLLTGFWYTDYYRTGAMASLFAIPLVAMGFAWLLGFVQKGLERLVSRGADGEVSPKSKRAIAIGSSAALIAVLLVTQVVSIEHTNEEGVDKTVASGWSRVNDVLQNYYSWEGGLTSEECAFVERALQDMPEGALIINYPHDGSGWLYGVAGANTYFRRTTNNGMAGSGPSELIRLHLCEVESNEEVRNLVRDLDAQYVLVLDTLDSEHPTYTELRYKPENWTGIEAIDESTPGFTLVACEDDMRLYRIDANAI